MLNEKKISNEITLLVAAMFVVTAVVLLFYFSKFNGPPSGISNDWGNFGSYLNGVLSPILLFSTLIYLARTLQAQRDLQEDQRNEFEAANKNQQKHIEKLEKANQQQQIAALRTELVKFIHNEMIIEEKFNSDLKDRLKIIKNKKLINENEEKEVEGFAEKMQTGFNRRLNLRNIASSLILKNFNTVDELREYFNKRYENLIEIFGKIYT